MITTEHPQTLVHVDHQAAWVDDGIAELIRLLWQHDWLTDNSCQDNHGRVWLHFPFLADGEAFLSTIAGDEPDDNWSLYRAIVQSGDPVDPVLSARLQRDHWWQYDVLPTDINEEPDGTRHGPAEVWMSLSVRFPPDHLDEVVKRLAPSAATLPTQV